MQVVYHKERALKSTVINALLDAGFKIINNNKKTEIWGS